MNTLSNNVIAKTPAHVVEQVLPNVWRVAFHLPGTVNCWLYGEDDGLTLVDAAQPWNARDILRAVDLVGKPLKRIVITHAHPDHAGAARTIVQETGAEVFAHESEIPYLTGTACMADVPGYWLCRTLLNVGRCLRILNPPKIEKVIPVGQDQFVGSLRVLHTPGHTPGSISLWSEEHKSLFCGDNISNTLKVLRLNFSHFTLDWSSLRRSLQLYESLPARVLLPGHGPAYQSNNAIDDVFKLIPPIK